jgi:hypothetical protein
MLELAHDRAGSRSHFVVVRPPLLLPSTDSEVYRHCLRLRLYFSKSKMFGMIDKGFGIGLEIWRQQRQRDGAGREALSIASGRLLVGRDREDKVEYFGNAYEVRRRKAVGEAGPVQQTSPKFGAVASKTGTDFPKSNRPNPGQIPAPTV